MFKTVLIANRGEIACRVMRTLRHMGIKSVAVFSEADSQSLHAQMADVAVFLGNAPAVESYLDADKILAAAKGSGAEAIHPGYGFLSENAAFSDRCRAEGITFVGPTPEQVLAFGLKHRARELARRAGVPLLPGSPLLSSPGEAAEQAARIGFPVMLKSTAGGGGIGLTLVRDAGALAEQYESVARLGEKNFKDTGVYLEKFVEHARHIEVQIFGDGKGRVVALGDRDCSVQRRNQKVIEESPAPDLTQSVRQAMNEAALKLAESVNYASAGTVEFIYDIQSERFYFLEVNTRLQVEHGVTEAVTGIDLVKWMMLQAAGEPNAEFSGYRHTPRGHAIQARVYAEDPGRGFRPSSGLLTRVVFPSDVRVDTWVEAGVDVPPFYDPLVAKLVAHGPSRQEAVAKLQAALAATRLSGIETNLEYLARALSTPGLRQGAVSTSFLAGLQQVSTGIEVLSAGTHTTVQDYPGRVGYWDVGIPPSGPMDSLSMRLGNSVVGNPEHAAALELTVDGPELQFYQDAVIALSGARMRAELSGRRIEAYEPIRVRAGQRLSIGGIEGPGLRSYLCVRGGIDVPEYLASRSTFTLGRFGGHGGRCLRAGDVLHPGALEQNPPRQLPKALQPHLTHDWELGVLYGPHGAPDFFTDGDIAQFFSATYEVHFNSARTGVRLIGPKPTWARPDGGEAGLHPSNIHDCAYAIGTVDFTGDMPILLGPDGPSLGGFVCPATVVRAELWKLGQLKPGDRVRFRCISLELALELERTQEHELRALSPLATLPLATVPPRGAVIAHTPEGPGQLEVQYRQAGDNYLLVEYGPMVLDLELRFRVHALMSALRSRTLDGILDLTPGIRSLQVHFDGARLEVQKLLDTLRLIEAELPDAAHMRVPTRIVKMPLSWDDEATQLAIDKYTKVVRKDAPWAPSNIEFIRRINGLSSIEDVKRVVYGASYLVLGLGDVYLGAPVATPVDPRHRLVTTKYNPARTWTPENAVGIGGAYLCIYGMEGPGGYQFVGRTLQVYNRFRATRDFEKPWLLRFFDQIQFYEVNAGELLELRRAFVAGRFSLEVRQEEFVVSDYRRFLQENRPSIRDFKARQQLAFEAERARWVEAGQLNFSAESDAPSAAAQEEIPAGLSAVRSQVPGNVWKIAVAAGERVSRGETLVIVESMKMEIAVTAPRAGCVVAVRCQQGRPVDSGEILVLLEHA